MEHASFISDLQDPPVSSNSGTAPTSSCRIARTIGLALLLLAVILVPLLAWSVPDARHLWAFTAFLPAVVGMVYAAALASRGPPATTLLSGLFARFALGWLVLFPTVYGVAIGFTYLLALVIDATGCFNGMHDGTALYITVAIFITVVVVVLAECGKAIASASNSSSSANRPLWVTSVYTALGLGTAESYYALLVLRVVWPEGTLTDSAANLGTSIVACTMMFGLMEVLASYHVSFGLVAGRAQLRHAARLLVPAMFFRSLCIATILILPALLDWVSHSGQIAVGASVLEALCYLLWVKCEERVMRQDPGKSDLALVHEPLATSTINVGEGAYGATETWAA